MRYHACIFDMDGTVLDTLATIAHFGNEALTAVGLSEIPTDAYRYLVGDGARILIQRMLSYLHQDQKLFDTVYPDYCARYEADFLHLTSVYDGIPELLQCLSSAKIPCAILTNKPDSTAQLIRRKMFREEDFAFCIGQQDGIPIKPSPEGAFLLAEKFGIPPEECLYIGDTGTDMDTGNAAGMDTVGVRWGFREKEELMAHGATYIVKHPMEIWDILRS